MTVLYSQNRRRKKQYKATQCLSDEEKCAALVFLIDHLNAFQSPYVNMLFVTLPR